MKAMGGVIPMMFNAMNRDKKPATPETTATPSSATSAPDNMPQRRRGMKGKRKTALYGGDQTLG